MGVDYTAYSLIGVRINNPKIKTTVRGCTHPEVKNGKYCPECASPMWVTTECRHPLLETIDEKEIENAEPYFRVSENQMVIVLVAKMKYMLVFIVSLLMPMKHLKRL